MSSDWPGVSREMLFEVGRGDSQALSVAVSVKMALCGTGSVSVRVHAGNQADLVGRLRFFHPVGAPRQHVSAHVARLRQRHGDSGWWFEARTMTTLGGTTLLCLECLVRDASTTHVRASGHAHERNRCRSAMLHSHTIET